jgi:hypothetical protein
MTIPVAESVKDLITISCKDPRVVVGVNIAQRLGNVLTLYKSHTGLKGIRKQESHNAKVRKIRRMLLQRHVKQKIKVCTTSSEVDEKRLARYASCCFLLEICRIGARSVPIVDAASVVGMGLLSCAEEKKIKRLQTEEKQEKKGWEYVKSRCRQMQYAISITAKVLVLVSGTACAVLPQGNTHSEGMSNIISKTQNVATAVGVIMALVTTYENRREITNALGSVGGFILNKVRRL